MSSTTWLLLHLSHILAMSKIPVIIDTDFGYAMDDTFAISFAVQQPDIFDIKLISTTALNTTKRAMLVTTFLRTIGSTEYDIGIGIATPCNNNPSYPIPIGCVGPIWPWMDSVNTSTLSTYKGTIYHDGIGRMSEIIEEHSETNPIYIIAVGPLTNLAAVFQPKPELKRNVRLFTMSGCLFRDSTLYGKFPEWNVVADIPAAQIVFNNRDEDAFNTGIVDVTWDTGYYFQISGHLYQAFLKRSQSDIVAKTILAIYRVQYAYSAQSLDVGVAFSPSTATPPLYDMETMWLVWYMAKRGETTANVSVPYLEVEEYRVEINASGYMVEDKALSPVYVVTKWRTGGQLKVAAEVVGALLKDRQFEVDMDVDLGKGEVDLAGIGDVVFSPVAVVYGVAFVLLTAIFVCKYCERKEYDSV